MGRPHITGKKPNSSINSERGADRGSSLLFMLIGGLVLIVVGAIIVMTFV